jgi:cytosine/adenosine deaminase-related metal-dependent hydrolase
VARNLNMYLDTLYSAFEMIASGITTVQHIHGWMPGKLAEVDGRADDVIRAYEDVGMRVSYSFAVRDQNRLVYQDDAEFVVSRRPSCAGRCSDGTTAFSSRSTTTSRYSRACTGGIRTRAG